jgi:hypothetical protein
MTEKNDIIFNEIIRECELKGLKNIMGFLQHWNKEIIAQFYATIYFGYMGTERAMFWMTEEDRWHIIFSNFLAFFRLPNDPSLRKLHDEGILNSRDMEFMYPRSKRAFAGTVKPLYTYYAVLNRLFRKTLTPRNGNSSQITAFQRNLMVAMRPGVAPFCVGDFIWQEIKNCSENVQNLCGHSPYIIYIIRKVTNTKYPKDARHRLL